MTKRSTSGAPKAPEASATAAVREHWHLYLFEGLELALFMVSACFFDVLLYDPASPVLHWIANATLRRFLMGCTMGGTAILIIRSPMGKRSGAHFNPAITLTYLRLKKIARWDAFFYIAGQFIGGIFGVWVAVLLIGNRRLALPQVKYIITVPGVFGTAGAFAAELLMGLLLMAVVLMLSNRPRLAPLTSYAMGVLISAYVLLFAPLSGFSINPARTLGSAVFAHTYTALWVYFSAPILGMLFSAEVYVRTNGQDRILCAKLHPDSSVPCPFHCNFPGHSHTASTNLVPEVS